MLVMKEKRRKGWARGAISALSQKNDSWLNGNYSESDDDNNNYHYLNQSGIGTRKKHNHDGAAFLTETHVLMVSLQDPVALGKEGSLNGEYLNLSSARDDNSG